MPLVGDESLAVPAFLVGRMETVRGTEIEEHPGRDSRKVRDVVEHLKIVTVEPCLIVLAPGRSLVIRTVLSVKGLPSEFGDNQRLASRHIPNGFRWVARPGMVPAHILVHRNDIQFLCEVILHHESLFVLVEIRQVKGRNVEP